RSSSMKYNGLCQPPYVMTIACKAITNPLNVIDGGMGANGCPLVGTRRHAATRPKNATHFSAVVTSWKKLLMRMPSHCNATMLTRIKIDKDRMAPSGITPSAAINSAIAIDKYPRIEQYMSQSVQPTANPAVLPKARRT